MCVCKCDVGKLVSLSSFEHTSPVRFQEELYLCRLKELDGVTSERDNVRKQFEDLRKQRLDLFMAGFSIITSKLKEMYQVRNGGDGVCPNDCPNLWGVVYECV